VRRSEGGKEKKNHTGKSQPTGGPWRERRLPSRGKKGQGRFHKKSALFKIPSEEKKKRKGGGGELLPLLAGEKRKKWENKKKGGGEALFSRGEKKKKMGKGGGPA